MSEATYPARVIVLRKTKLGETDLILTMLAEDGSRLRAVAKGARKPQSVFASRLELYSIADVLNARGRNLDIVKEARLVDSNDALRGDVVKTGAAGCMVELLERITQDDLEQARLFDMTQCALESMCQSDETHILSVVAAHLLKALAYVGLKPCLTECAICSRPVCMDSADTSLRFSVEDGGVLCEGCANEHAGQCLFVRAETINRANALLHATFDEILHSAACVDADRDVLVLLQSWIEYHVGYRLKSLRFLLTV